jgi:hypothetical protein
MRLAAFSVKFVKPRRMESRDRRKQTLAALPSALNFVANHCLASELTKALHLVGKIPTRFSRLSSSCVLPSRDEKGLGIDSRG